MANSKVCSECKQPLPHHFMSNKIPKETVIAFGRKRIAGYYCSNACRELRANERSLERSKASEARAKNIEKEASLWRRN